MVRREILPDVFQGENKVGGCEQMKEKIKTIGSYVGFVVLVLFLIYIWGLSGFVPACRWSIGECYYAVYDWDGDGIEECDMTHCWDGKGLVCFWEHWGECEPE